MSNSKFDPTRSLQQDLLETPLPDGWVLREEERKDGEATRYFATVPGTAVSTPAFLDPEEASERAHEKHQSYINQHGEPPSPEAEAREVGAPSLPAPPEPEVPERVYDEKKDEWIAISPESRDLFQYMNSVVQGTDLINGLALQAIRDHKYYLYGGFSSFKEFCDEGLSFSRMTAYRRIRRAEQFADFLPGVFDPENIERAMASGRNPMAVLAGGDEAALPEPVQNLSAGKMDLIGGLSDEQKESYMDEGVIRLESGEELTVEDIRAETVKDLRSKFEREREAQKRKLEEIEERALKAEAERDALRGELEKEKERIETARTLEDHYGAKHSKLEEKRRVMEEVRGHLDEAIRLLPQVGITPEDPEADQENLLELLQRINRLEDVFNADYGEVRINLGI